MSVQLVKELKKDSREMRDIFSDILAKQMAEDDLVCYLDADLASCVKTKKLIGQYPDRAINCGIAEANMIGVAAGMSAAGMKPYAHTFAPFASRRVMDQVFMSVAYAKLNVRIIGSDPGVTAAYNGGTHMPFEDMSVMLSIPTATVIEPADCAQFSSIMRQVKDRYGLFYIRMLRKNPVAVYTDDSEFEIGKGVTVRTGKDVTIIASGIMLEQALKAAEILASEGIDARVINMFTWKPIDEELIRTCARETGAIVTAENHNILCGLGSAVSNVVTSIHPVPVVRMGIEDEFGEVGPEDYLRNRYQLTAESIAGKAKIAIDLKCNK
jgi:transketolase